MTLLRRLLPVVVLVAAVLWVQWDWLAGPSHLTAHHDNLDGAAPLRIEAARQWRSGQLPLWNPYKRGGMPLLADTTAGAAYPLNAPFLWVDTPGDRAFSVFDAMDLVAAIHAVLGALFLYLFLCVLGANASAAALGGLVWACCGTSAWLAAWYIQMQNSAVWAPLVLAAVHRAAQAGPHRLRWIAIGALAVAMQWLAGYPEFSVYTGLIAIVYAITQVRSYGWRLALESVGAIYLAGMTLAAVQLLPALELQWLSRRPAQMPLEMFQSLPASVAMLKEWIAGAAAGGFEFPPLSAYRFGAAAVALAAVAVFSRSRVALFFAALLLVAVLLSLGAATPVNALAWHIPGLNAFRHPHKHLFEIALAMSVLAGLGAARVAAWLRIEPRAALLLVVMAGAASAAQLRENQNALAAGNPAGVDLSGTRPALLEHLEPGWRVLAPRFVFQPRDPQTLLGDYPTQFRTLALHGAGPYLNGTLAQATGTIEEETTFRKGLFAGDDRALALLSVRYLVQSRRDGTLVTRVDPEVWHPVFDSPAARLVERNDALARFRFVAQARCGSGAEIQASLEHASPEPRDVALVDCGDGDPLDASFADPATLGVELAAEQPGHIVLATQVPAGRRGFLVVSQPDVPGWHAVVDGAQVPLRRVHGLVQGLVVPGEARRVELVYRPLSFCVGAGLSLASLIVLLSAVALGVRRYRAQMRGT